MTSLHWLISTVFIWVSSSGAAAHLGEPNIMWAPGVTTVALIIAMALQDNIRDS